MIRTEYLSCEAVGISFSRSDTSVHAKFVRRIGIQTLDKVKAVLTAYKIKINRKLQRLHNLLIRYLIDKGEAIFQIFKNAVFVQ
jgi:hypothetical protein